MVGMAICGAIAGGGALTGATAAIGRLTWTGLATGAAATAGRVEKIWARIALAGAVPSKPQTGQLTVKGICPFIGSTSNLYF